MAPYYLTTPIYYVNDAPHVGTAYTTVNADALARWHRLLGDDVFFMTGTDEHGAKIVEAAEAHGTSPQEWTDRTSARFVEAWKRLDISNDDFIRTTEPRHHAVVQEFLQRIYDNGFIELGQYTGLYCVSCEDYYTADQLVDGKCPVHGRPVIEMQEDNYFFRLSAFEQPLLDYYESHPDFVRPNAKRNEALGFIRGGLNDVSITRTSFRWGVPVPWDDGHVFYVWYDALDQLPHRGLLRQRPAAVRIPLVAGGTPPDRQGHLEVPLRLVARHVHGGRHRPAPGDLRPRVSAHGRPEAGEDDDPVRRGRRGRRGPDAQDHRSLPAGPGRRIRGRPLRYHLLRDVAARGRRRLLLRGDRGALQRRPGQQSGQSRLPGGHRRPLQVRRRRAGPRPGQPTGAPAAEVLRASTRRLGPLGPP